MICLSYGSPSSVPRPKMSWVAWHVPPCPRLSQLWSSSSVWPTRSIRCLQHDKFKPNSLQPAIFLELPSVFTTIVGSNCFQLPSDFSFHSHMEILEDCQHLILVFSGETHSFQLWSSMNVMKYYNQACDFVSTWHTSVCPSSNGVFCLAGGRVRKEVRFCLPAK